MAAPFKIYPDFECIVKRVKGKDKNNDTSYTEKDQDHIPFSFSDKLECIDDKFSKPIVLYRGKNVVYKFIEAILEEYEYYKKVKNEYFNKNLVMSVEDEKWFQSSNKCSTYNKLFTNEGKRLWSYHSKI